MSFPEFPVDPQLEAVLEQIQQEWNQRVRRQRLEQAAPLATGRLDWGPGYYCPLHGIPLFLPG